MKLKYAVDKDNRLKVIPPKSHTSLRPRGKFRINKNNQLEYWLNEPLAWRRLYGLPGKISFKGRWKLTANHDLELTLQENRWQAQPDRLLLRTKIISAGENSLVFEFAAKDEATGRLSFNIISLSGTWNTDENNRLIFEVNRKTAPETLVFKSSWQLNKNQQIEYTYEKTSLIRKTNDKHTFTLQGFWKISSRAKLTYILGADSSSGIQVRAHLEKPDIYPGGRRIEYRLGAGFRQLAQKNQHILSLYGQWQFSPNLNLSFLMDYGKAGYRKIEFSADLSFQRNKIVCTLQNEEGEPLGITLTISRQLLSRLHPQAFLRLKSRKNELGVEAGLHIPF